MADIAVVAGAAGVAVDHRAFVAHDLVVVQVDGLDAGAEIGVLDRLAGRVAAAHLRLVGADQAIDVAALVRHHVDQADIGQQAVEFQRIEIAPPRHQAAGALLVPVVIDVEHPLMAGGDEIRVAHELQLEPGAARIMTQFAARFQGRRVRLMMGVLGKFVAAPL